MATFAAVDLGASSGRVLVADVDADRLVLHEAHRFANPPVALPDGLHWDLLALYRELLHGLRAAGRLLTERGLPALSGIGIDSWAVDYGLLDADGVLIANPYHYRDGRTGRGVERVHELVAPEQLYQRNGLQFLPFTTAYQLAAEPAGRLAGAGTLLLVPDLLGYWLTGSIGAEVTNASTTGLLDVRTGRWDVELAGVLGFDPGLLPPLRRPGDLVGRLRPEVADETGLDPATPVLAVGSHDTASAVVGVPADGDRFGYVSCGTWSLVGLELAAPVLTEASSSPTLSLIHI